MITAENFIFLRTSVGFSRISTSQAQVAINNSDFIITANIENNIVGMARLMTDGLQVLIMDVIVYPDYQGMGIGRGLMEHIMTYIKTMTCDGNQIRINLITNDGKTGFYEKFGFHKAAGMLLKV